MPAIQRGHAFLWMLWEIDSKERKKPHAPAGRRRAVGAEVREQQLSVSVPPAGQRGGVVALARAENRATLRVREVDGVAGHLRDGGLRGTGIGYALARAVSVEGWLRRDHRGVHPD